jgi:hypothetical protein
MPLLKKVFLALGAAVLTVLFVWYLYLPLYRAARAMDSLVSVTLPLVGTPLIYLRDAEAGERSEAVGVYRI